MTMTMMWRWLYYFIIRHCLFKSPTNNNSSFSSFSTMYPPPSSQPTTLVPPTLVPTTLRWSTPLRIYWNPFLVFAWVINCLLLPRGHKPKNCLLVTVVKTNRWSITSRGIVISHHKITDMLSTISLCLLDGRYEFLEMINKSLSPLPLFSYDPLIHLSINPLMEDIIILLCITT